MDNTIFTSMDGTIGYFSDIEKGYKQLIQEAIEDNDFELAEDLTEQLKEINEYKDFDGLLSLSMNNGFGFTVEPVIRADLLAKDIKHAFGNKKFTEEEAKKLEEVINKHFEGRWLA